MIESKIVRSGDRFVIEIEGKLIAPIAYMSYQPDVADYARFTAAGFELLFVGVYASDRGINPHTGLRPMRPGFWTGEDQFDFSAVDEDFRIAVQGRAPGEAYIIPRVMLEVPPWWEKAHPEELCRDFSGASLHQSFSSEKWYADAERVMARFQDWLAESGWDRYVAGWHLAAGSTQEFLRTYAHDDHYIDYSELSKRTYRQWLSERYEGDIQRLNAAWGARYAAFEDIQPATPAERRYQTDTPRARDFYRFYHVETAMAVVRLCEACKRVCGGRQIVGAFYGYTASAIDVGHHAADVVLASPAVDFLASPFCYNDARPLGGDLSLPGAVDSTLLHGKIWFMEADIRTCHSQQMYDCTPFVNPNAKLAFHNPVWEGPETVEGSLSKMTQAFGRVLTGGLAMWWFDMWGGWYRDQAFMDFIVKAKAIYDRAALSGQSRQTAQFAVFADGDSGPFLTEFLLKMSRMGLPWHVFVSEDIPLVNPDDYRVGCFLSEKSWAAARERWTGDNRSLILAGWGETGEVRVRLENGAAIYSGIGREPEPALLREAANVAGAHIYAYTDDIIYADAHYVCIHAASSGQKRIYLPHMGRLRDALTGREYERYDHFTDFMMEKGETLLFEILPVEDE